jgi:hypothetical protein
MILADLSRGTATRSPGLAVWSNNDKLFRYDEAAPQADDARQGIEARLDRKRLLQ